MFLVKDGDKEAIELVIKLLAAINMSVENDFYLLTEEEMKILKDKRIIPI